MMLQTMDLTKGVATHSRGAKVMEGIGSREPHGFQGNLWEAHHPQKESNPMDRMNLVCSIQTKQGVLGKTASWGGPEEFLG